VAEELTPESDASPGDWIASRLLEWGSNEGTPAGAIIPTGFDAYARVFHDADGRRWADIAREHGTTLHAGAQFTRLVGVHWSEHPRGCPPTGALPSENARALVEVLRPSTIEPCYFGLWRGYGWIEGNTVRVVRVPQREYLLFRGPLEIVLDGPWTRWHQTPNLWWPQDRTWFVATEIDFDSTLVGGSRSLIDAVLARADLEALEITLDTRLDWFGDELNPVREDA
jgi:hypothetical protein